MKILLSNAVVSHGAFHHWMTADLRALGHEVFTIDPDELCEQFGIELYRRTLLQRIATDRPDVLLVYPPYDLLREQEARVIRAQGTVIVGFAYDDPIFLPTYTDRAGDFEAICAQHRSVYDLYFTTSRQMVKEAADRGITWLQHIRWACNTPDEPRNAARDLPLVVIGAPYPRRVKMVKHLKDAGIKPMVFGAEGWKTFLDVADCYNGMLTRTGMFEMYHRAKIALAPADWESLYTPMVKLRSLEIAACAPLQISEQCDDLGDYYTDGVDVVSYAAHNWDELAGKIRYYLTDEPARARIARAGFDRTLRDHVWKVRWREIEEQAAPLVEQRRRGPSVAIVSAPTFDKTLPTELGLAACAGHYEKLGDYSTALIAYDEWLAIQPDLFNALLGKARVLYWLKKYAESEHCFNRALEQSEILCNIGVDITVTQRKLGPRLGLGRLFNGIFPRKLECCTHLLLIYGATDQESKAEDLMSALAVNQDHLFVAIVAMVAEPGLEQILSPKYAARYVEVLLSTTPKVWAGEWARHQAHFWLLRGQAIAALGRVEEGRQCMLYALTQNPYPQVQAQIEKQLAIMG